ncbi:farnesol dehydrogenase-like [Topomyia yanbarensis]|uniref:farnesol dehydrogenase-like n=1 Tax=Topomyia yanbarensis TaxID=2498891 RepID=UPI00273C7C48|nr:farnesol dehydrogenase-like [Topomyia yanbarensis]
MERWVGKVALVTGASSGIGAAIAKELARSGLTTVGLARRVERVEALKSELTTEAASRLIALKCDITKEEDILSAFAFVNRRFGGIAVLVNNAGVSSDTTVLTPENTKKVREIFDTNVIALIQCSREAFQSMKKQTSEGHIININSVSGHYVLDLPRQSVYSPSKFAVTALTETMRNELRKEKTNIKVTSISPGIVKTEILEGVPGVDLIPTLEPEDIADAVRYVLSTPPRVQIHELMIRPMGEPF